MKLNFRKTIGGPSFFSRFSKPGDHEFVNPLRDWTIGLFVAVCIFLGGVGAIGLDFYLQFGAPNEAVPVEEQTVVYREREVVQYAEEYNKKETRFKELRTHTVSVPAKVEEVASTTTAATEEVAPLADESTDEYTTPVPTSP